MSKTKGSAAKRLLWILIAVLIVAYVGYQVYQALYSPVEIEIARAYSAYDTIDVEALVIRDETVIRTPVKGYLYYTCEDGTRIAKNGTIAQVYANQSDAMDRQQVTGLDEEIDMLSSITSTGATGMMSLDMVGKQMGVALKNVTADGISLSYNELAEKRFELLTMLNKRRVTVGKEQNFSARIRTLTAKKENLTRHSSSARGTVTSPISGYFVSRVDGYETAFDYKRATALTVADIQNAKEDPALLKGGSVGKIVGDYQWYFACVIPAEEASKLAVGQDLSILLPFVSSSAVPVSVASLNRDREGNVAATFVCSYMSAKLSSIRREEASIRIKEYAGLYVRDTALRFNDAKEPGVFIRAGDTLYFRKVNIIYHDENGRFSVCEKTDDPAFLQLYDDVVIAGKGLYDGKIIN